MKHLKSTTLSAALVLLLLLFTLLGSGPTPAHVGHIGQGPSPKRIDWTHPIALATLLHPSQSDGAGARSPQRVLGVHTPQANFPTNCYQNTAYYVKVLGQISWSQTYQQFRTTVCMVLGVQHSTRQS